jgi:serine/threonine protein kinase/PKD repeat protein
MLASQVGALAAIAPIDLPGREAWRSTMSGAHVMQTESSLSEMGRRMNEIGSLADPSSRIREYSRLVDEFPNASLAAFNLALDLWRNGRREEARDAARRAVGIAPELIEQLPPGLAISLRAKDGSGETTDRIGVRVAGFRITHRISEDPRTLLYRAERDSAIGYLRVLRRTLSQDQPIAERFIESAKLLQRVSHGGLATILDAGMLADGCAYVLLQPEPGEPLSERIWRKEPLAPLAPALVPLAEALATLHAQGLCYLGIQPERIQVVAGHELSMQLLDSEHVRGAILRLPMPTIANGPVREGVDPVLFMAPETFSGRAEVGPPADVYALGALAYVVLCGRPPLQAESIGEVIAAHLNQAPSPVRSVAPDVPEELARLIEAMLDKDPDRRPSMAIVAERWAQLLPAQPAQPAPPTQEAPAPAAKPDLAVGMMLGDYRLVRKLGEGRTGVVFEGYNERLRRRDAIKVIRPEYCRSEDDAQRFLREVQAANQVAHTGIVSVLQQARAPNGQIYTVMEYLEGDSLRDRIKQGPMPTQEVQRLCWHIALAMTAVHEQGVIHRDLKPENVIVVPDPDVTGGERTKIVDFGTANLTESPSPGRSYVEGTPGYMSPEQLRDTRTAGTKTDVYALGVIMYEMLTGGGRPGGVALPANCPRWLAALIQRMLAQDPSRRSSMKEVADELSKRHASPWRWIGLAGAIVGVAGIAIGAYLWHRHVEASKPAAAFAYQVQSSTRSSITAKFENHTTGSRERAEWLWTFGDGATSTEEAPVHGFTCTAEKNSFTVSLRASNAYDRDGNTLTKPELIRITPPPAPAPRVKGVITQGCPVAGPCERELTEQAAQALQCEAPCKLRLEDTSGGTPAQICWRYGATEAERCGRALRVEQEYNSPGSYAITRRAIYDCGQTTTATLQLRVMRGLIAPKPTARFTYELPDDMDRFPVAVAFKYQPDEAEQPFLSKLRFAWDLGGGKTSRDMNTERKFSRPGTYKVTLVVQTPEGLRNTTSQDVTIPEPPPTPRQPSTSTTTAQPQTTSPRLTPEQCQQALQWAEYCYGHNNDFCSKLDEGQGAQVKLCKMSCMARIHGTSWGDLRSALEKSCQ